MLAGQTPHLGGSAQQIIMKIIAEPVDTVTRYRKSVPPNVAAALARALEKLPADPFGSASEFAERSPIRRSVSRINGGGRARRDPERPTVTVTRSSVFDHRPFRSGNTSIRGYDLTREGQHFVFARLVRPVQQVEPIVVLNWLEEVKRLMAAASSKQ